MKDYNQVYKGATPTLKVTCATLSCGATAKKKPELTALKAPKTIDNTDCLQRPEDVSRTARTEEIQRSAKEIGGHLSNMNAGVNRIIGSRSFSFWTLGSTLN